MTLNDASHENLSRAIKGLNRAGIKDYVIIGGWCPFLNRKDKFHPGTIDVDILFKDACKPYNLKNYIKEMRHDGYFTFAKHRFQLLNVFEVEGVRFCFNIDLLHTGTEEQGHELFVDQLDLNVLLNDEADKTVKMCSIVQKESVVIFDEALYETKTLDCGTTMNLINYTGLFITKTKSCQLDKRDRDSYDIYLGFENDLIDIERLCAIRAKNYAVNIHVEKFMEFISTPESRSKFDARVNRYRRIDTSPSEYILKKLNS